MHGSKFETIDDYLKNFPDEVRTKLETIRQVVKEIAPEAKEKIAYGIPTFTRHGNLVHFAGYEHHVSLYPGSAPIKELEKELKGYKTSKGTVQFPLDKPLPLDLIKKITKACVAKNKKQRKWITYDEKG